MYNCPTATVRDRVPNYRFEHCWGPLFNTRRWWSLSRSIAIKEIPWYCMMDSARTVIWCVVLILGILPIQPAFSTNPLLHQRVAGAESVCRSDFGRPGLFACLTAEAAIHQSGGTDMNRPYWWSPTRSNIQGSPGDIDRKIPMICGYRWGGLLPHDPGKLWS